MGHEVDWSDILVLRKLLPLRSKGATLLKAASPPLVTPEQTEFASQVLSKFWPEEFVQLGKSEQTSCRKPAFLIGELQSG